MEPARDRAPPYGSRMPGSNKNKRETRAGEPGFSIGTIRVGSDKRAPKYPAGPQGLCRGDGQCELVLKKIGLGKVWVGFM